MDLTDAQYKALNFLSGASYATPADIGHAIGGTKRGKAQGLGRIGGSMAARLVKAGLLEDASFLRGGHPAYRITKAGRQAIERHELKLED